MPKITEEDLTVVQIRLFTSDYKKLQELFGSDPRTSVTKVIRTIIRTWVNQHEAGANVIIDKVESREAPLGNF